jgi:hypothetical protein
MRCTRSRCRRTGALAFGGSKQHPFPAAAVIWTVSQNRARPCSVAVIATLPDRQGIGREGCGDRGRRRIAGIDRRSSGAGQHSAGRRAASNSPVPP